MEDVPGLQSVHDGRAQFTPAPRDRIVRLHPDTGTCLAAPQGMAVVDVVAVVPHGRATVSRWWSSAEHAPSVVPDAELVEANDHRVLSWRSRSNAETSAVAHLSDAPGGCTQVRLVVSGPGITEAARMVISREITCLDHQLGDALAGRPGSRAPEDAVQTTSEESFPASDAPGWTPLKGATNT